MALSFLDFNEIPENGNNKEVIVNGNMLKVGDKLTLSLTLDVAAGGTFSLTEAQFDSFARIILSGVAASAVTLDLPSAGAGMIIVDNECGQPVVVQVSGGGGVVNIPDGGLSVVWKTTPEEGSHVSPLSSTGEGSIYLPTVSGYYNGAPSSDDILARLVVTKPTKLPVGLALSQGFAEISATAETTFSILKNDVQIGTMVFPIAGTVATFTAASETSFVAGDRIGIKAPFTADATLANISFSIQTVAV